MYVEDREDLELVIGVGNWFDEQWRYGGSDATTALRGKTVYRGYSVLGDGVELRQVGANTIQNTQVGSTWLPSKKAPECDFYVYHSYYSFGGNDYFHIGVSCAASFILNNNAYDFYFLASNKTGTQTEMVSFDSSYFQIEVGNVGGYSGCYGYVDTLTGFADPYLFETDYPLSVGMYSRFPADNDWQSEIVHVTPWRNPYNVPVLDNSNPILYSHQWVFECSQFDDADDSDFEFEMTLFSGAFGSTWANLYDAYQDGFMRGNQTSGENSTGTAFGVIGNAFEAMASFMNTQVIGGLTIGALVGIPITVTVIIILAKWLRK